MFRGNALLTGVAGGTLPEPLELIWTRQVEGKNESIESSEAIVHRNDRWLHACAEFGRWQAALEIFDGRSIGRRVGGG
jgi:hypothetical protein